MEQQQNPQTLVYTWASKQGEPSGKTMKREFQPRSVN